MHTTSNPISVALLAVLSPSTAADEADSGCSWIPGSTRAIDQLSGEVIQLWHDGERIMVPTEGRCLTRADSYGTDLGVPVCFPGQILFLFGDTWTCLPDAQGVYRPQVGWGNDDSIGYLDTPVDLASWPTLTVGRLPGETPVARPAMKLFLKPASAAPPRMWPTAIACLQSDQLLGNYEVPTGAFALNDHLYACYNVRHQEGLDAAGKKIVFFLNSILARSTTPSTMWQQDQPPTMERLYDISDHPVVDDTTQPPSDADARGKFIHVAPVVLDHQTLERTGIAAKLPDPLKTAARVILMWGSSWRYVHSNCYLAAVDADRIDHAVMGRADPAHWWYCTGSVGGTPTWSHDEAAAAPLIDDWTAGVGPSIGEHSVAWNASLGRYILSYQERYSAIHIRTATTPWGPWSPPTAVFGLTAPASREFIHHRDEDSIGSYPIPVFHENGDPLTEDQPSGATYGPYLIDRSTANADGSVTLYFTMSTWRPYQVFLMSTRFRIATAMGTGRGMEMEQEPATRPVDPAAPRTEPPEDR